MYGTELNSIECVEISPEWCVIRITEKEWKYYLSPLDIIQVLGLHTLLALPCEPDSRKIQ